MSPRSVPKRLILASLLRTSYQPTLGEGGGHRLSQTLNDTLSLSTG